MPRVPGQAGAARPPGAPPGHQAALGHGRSIPDDRLVAALEGTPRLGSVFGARKRARGLSFRATDVEWAWGRGPEVHGPGEAILLTLLGRRHPLPELAGDGAADLARRVRASQPVIG